MKNILFICIILLISTANLLSNIQRSEITIHENDGGRLTPDGPMGYYAVDSEHKLKEGDETTSQHYLDCKNPGPMECCWENGSNGGQTPEEWVRDQGGILAPSNNDLVLYAKGQISNGLLTGSYSLNIINISGTFLRTIQWSSDGLNITFIIYVIYN